MLAGKAGSPVLTSVSAAYVQRNLRPKVTSFTVHPAGTVFQKPYPTGDPDIAGFDDQAPDRRILSATPNPGSSSSALGRRAYQRGLQTFVWRAEDANDDELRYEILYRREGETGWKSLKSDLEDAIFVWDTTSVPNGTYVVKVMASDEASNTPGARARRRARKLGVRHRQRTAGGHRHQLAPANGRTTIQFEVRDEWSSISKVEYSLDAQHWQVVYPRDGIFDGRTEQFELTLADGDAAKGLIIRAYDAKNNSATAAGMSPLNNENRKRRPNRVSITVRDSVAIRFRYSFSLSEARASSSRRRARGCRRGAARARSCA